VQPKSKEWFLKLLSPLVIAALMAVWFVGFHKSPGHPPMVWPYRWEYWHFLANLVSLGFGYKTDLFIIAFLSLGIVVWVLWKNLKKAFSFQEQFISLGFFGSLAVMGALASVALSRTGFGIGQAKTSRYAELAFLLVPFVGWLWWSLAQQSERQIEYFKYFIWFVILGYIGDLSAYGTYFKVQQDRTVSLECIAQYYRGENKTGDCPILYPGPIGQMLDTAKRLKLSWVPIQ
jgi:hypothetical protein